MEALQKEEVREIIQALKESGDYEGYRQMILDDFETHRVVYKLEEDEIIALAYKHKTTPYALKEFYNWFEMNLLVEEDDYGYE